MSDLTTLTFGAAATLGVAASLILATPSAASPPGAAPPSPPELIPLRARGPAGLDDLLARRRVAEAAPGFDAAAWDRAVDTVAAQRYATRSHLYWYTDLDAAEAEAHRTHRPILSLRMLGDLREDLSCANSRLFRAVLYANTEVSALLRDHFVLYWSSERAVPRVTIDYGDGRKLVRTTTGNSAHYVLDEDGHVLDVLPGLYAPLVFQTELKKSLALADQVRGADAATRTAAVVAYHRAGVAAADAAWEKVPGTQYLRGARRLLHGSAAAIAQAATVSKMRIEVPDLCKIGMIGPSELPADQTEAWSTIGQALYGFAGTRHGHTGVLDQASRDLVVAIHNAGNAPRITADDDLIARLEQSVVADTALDELRLRAEIRAHLVEQPGDDFATLNAWIYARVFATPRSDPWLGLLQRTDFTGLPGDGVVMP
jgi:hypothetical protein